MRLHANHPHHQQAVHAALGPDPASRIAELSSEQVEDAVVAAGGVAAAVRTAEQWRQSPAGVALAAGPLLELHQVAAGAARARSLQGLRVLDLTRVIAGPEATRILSAYGADVVRVDSPT